MINLFSFILISFIFLFILTFIFFGKEHLESIELKYFGKLLIIGLCGLILEGGSYCSIKYLGDTLTTHIINKAYLIQLIVFSTIFYNYIIYISKSHDFYLKYHDLIKKVSMIVMGILSLLIILLEVKIPENKIYSYGPACNIIFVYASLVVNLCILTLIINFKNMKTNSVKQLLMYVVGTGLVGIVQFLNPEFTLSTTVDAIILFIMYFTIENPDVKMIEKLEILTEEANRANSAKTDFLSNMSHEIRTPLNAIIGFSQGLLEEDLPDESKNEVEDIIGASNSLLEIVNGILDISKIEANKLEIVNKEYNFEKIFKELVNLSHGRLGDKPLEFRYKYDHSIPPVLYGDYVRVKQIVLNLLTNAIKYTRDGYVAFNVSSVIKDDVCRLIISVEDSGIGIKEENIDKLFSKFERFDLEKNITIEGTGLGLAITKKLVELMNGKIVVQSKYGEGSKFTVAIDQRIVPKTLEDIGIVNENEISDIFVAPNAKVLVVDDNTLNIKVAQRLLKSFEINPDCVLSGQECLNKILDGNHYDLILLDDMMPKMTGTETLKNLKMIIGFEMPVVALTANAISGMKEKYLEAGFNDYLSKPIDKNELEIILRKYIEGENIIDNNTDTCQNSTLSDNIVSEVNVEELNSYDINILVNAGVDIDHSLELLGDMETINETFEAFLEESNTRLPNIKEYKDNNDMPNYAILVHAMKSDSKYLGMMTLADLAYNHEMASKANDSNYVNEHYDELMCEVNRMLEVIKKYLGR